MCACWSPATARSAERDRQPAGARPRYFDEAAGDRWCLTRCRPRSFQPGAVAAPSCCARLSRRRKASWRCCPRSTSTCCRRSSPRRSTATGSARACGWPASASSPRRSPTRLRALRRRARRRAARARPPEDLLAPLYTGDGGGADPRELAAERARRAARPGRRRCSSGCRARRSTSPSWAPSARPPSTCSTPARPGAGRPRWRIWTRRSASSASSSPRVVVVDFDWAARRAGRAALHDARLWYLGRMRLNPAGHALLADLVAGRVAAHRGAGAQGGRRGPRRHALGRRRRRGRADRRRRRRGGRRRSPSRTSSASWCGCTTAACCIVALHEERPGGRARGVRAIPAMVLRREHFVAERVNWQDKATNLRGAGRGARPRARLASCSSTTTRASASGSARRCRWSPCRSCPRTRPTARRSCARGPGSDARGHRRRPQARRQLPRAGRPAPRPGVRGVVRGLPALARAASSRSSPSARRRSPRAAQLCQRTNQFNLTTRRHTAADLERMLADPAHELVHARVSRPLRRQRHHGPRHHRFTPTGEAELDTLLLSCRVLGRRVEDAFLAVPRPPGPRSAARARSSARYGPTERNAQVAVLLPRSRVRPGRRAALASLTSRPVCPSHRRS